MKSTQNPNFIRLTKSSPPPPFFGSLSLNIPYSNPLQLPMVVQDANDAGNRRLVSEFRATNRTICPVSTYQVDRTPVASQDTCSEPKLEEQHSSRCRWPAPDHDQPVHGVTQAGGVRCDGVPGGPVLRDHEL